MRTVQQQNARIDWQQSVVGKDAPQNAVGSNP